MNKALTEFVGKESNFEWAALAQVAKDHMNPKQLIKDIYENGYEDAFKEAYSEGVIDGKVEMAIKIAVVGAPLAIIGTYNLWNRHIKSKDEIERLAKENAKLKAEEFVGNLENMAGNDDIINNVIDLDFKFKAKKKDFQVD